MSSITYASLKKLFQQSRDLFKKEYEGDPEIVRRVIAVLARSRNDNGWPLEMLEILRPGLARALRHWTAGGYEDIRSAQEAGNSQQNSFALNLEEGFLDLPLWKGSATHYSKDSMWYDKLSAAPLKLSSFMGCCKPAHTYAYVSNPAVILIFQNLKTARLVGALSTENCEGEILLPKGAIFKVAAPVDPRSQKVVLIEQWT